MFNVYDKPRDVGAIRVAAREVFELRDDRTYTRSLPGDVRWESLVPEYIEEI